MPALHWTLWIVLAISAVFAEQNLGFAEVQTTPAATVEDAMTELVTPLLEHGRPWSPGLADVLRKHLKEARQAGKKQADASADTVGAGHPDGVSTSATGVIGDPENPCSIIPTAASLVGGWASQSVDRWGTYTRMYNRGQFAYQDSRTGYPPTKFPDVTFRAMANRTVVPGAPVTYLIISVSSRWSAEHSTCFYPPFCTQWGSDVYKASIVYAIPKCAQTKCWESARCLRGICFLHISVADYDPQQGYTSLSGIKISLTQDGINPATGKNIQRAAFAMCSPCTTEQCT